MRTRLAFSLSAAFRSHCIADSLLSFASRERAATELEKIVLANASNCPQVGGVIAIPCEIWSVRCIIYFIHESALEKDAGLGEVLQQSVPCGSENTT